MDHKARCEVVVADRSACKCASHLIGVDHIAVVRERNVIRDKVGPVATFRSIVIGQSHPCVDDCFDTLRRECAFAECELVARERATEDVDCETATELGRVGSRGRHSKLSESRDDKGVDSIRAGCIFPDARALANNADASRSSRVTRALRGRVTSCTSCRCRRRRCRCQEDCDASDHPRFHHPRHPSETGERSRRRVNFEIGCRKRTRKTHRSEWDERRALGIWLESPIYFGFSREGFRNDSGDERAIRGRYFCKACREDSSLVARRFGMEIWVKFSDKMPVCALDLIGRRIRCHT
jgi:hypothetical protein